MVGKDTDDCVVFKRENNVATILSHHSAGCSTLREKVPRLKRLEHPYAGSVPDAETRGLIRS
jgi:hypothetical protein